MMMKTTPIDAGVGMRRPATMWFATLLLFVVLGSASCIHLETILVPAVAPKDAHLKLECKYRLDPGESLYSVKWYKDGNEFFRYVPRDRPPKQAFELPGVDIDEANCTETSVTVGPINFLSPGRYRCEVSGEAPLFQTVSQHRDLIAVYVLNDGPKIFGRRSRYHLNELVRVNCSSGRSRPAADLSWHINGEQVEEALIKGFSEEEGEDGFFVSNLGLEFRLQSKHFKSGDLKLKCVAAIASVYNRTKEESIEGERPLRAPALESRDSAVAGDTRADRVQARGNMKSRTNYILLLFSLIHSTCTLISSFAR